jgi:RNA polymerase sigma-70 factor (ECF subfamily)
VTPERFGKGRVCAGRSGKIKLIDGDPASPFDSGPVQTGVKCTNGSLYDVYGGARNVKTRISVLILETNCHFHGSSAIVTAACALLNPFADFAMPDEPVSTPEIQDEAAALDLALMQKVKTGDADAFQELVELHQHRVVGTVAKMLGDETEAEDVAQQVFVRVWRSASRYEPTAKFTTWLFKITRNLVFNEMRRRKRHVAVSLDQPRDSEDERPLQAVDHSSKSPDTAVLDEEMMGAIHKAIEELPETQRMAIILRRYEETPYEEIAEILELSVPAVKSLLFRARTELREKLRRYLEA